MSRTRIAVLFLLTTFYISAQAQDSLYQAWTNEAASDSSRLDAMDNIVWKLIFSQPDSAEQLAIDMYDFAYGAGEKGWQGRALYHRAVSWQLRSDLDQAQQFCQQAGTLFDPDLHGRWMIRNLISQAMILNGQEKTGESVHIYKEALKVAEANGLLSIITWA